jgi:hypothetical protein
MSKTCLVTTPFINITSNIASHRSAQGMIYVDQLKQLGYDVTVNFHSYVQDFNDFDVMAIYHGNDWNGLLTFPGGIEASSTGAAISKLSKFKGEVISLGLPCPNYADQIQKKWRQCEARGKKPMPDFYNIDFDNLREIEKKAITKKYPCLTENLIIGDSHAISLYRPGWTVNSIPFKTLHGALQIGLQQFIDEPYHGTEMRSRSLGVYFGAIDIRHHILRQEDPVQAVYKLACDYFVAISDLSDKFQSIDVYEILPIENESRKIPSSGYYKGTPFYGSWAARNAMRKEFNNEVRALIDQSENDKLKLIRWTDYLLNDDGELDFKHMEKPRSVHLSRGSYPYWTGKEWNENFMKIKRNTTGLEGFMEEDD